MSDKLYYYNAFITLNGRKTDIPFSLLLDRIVILDDEIKFIETKHGEYSLLKMKLPEENRDINDRSVCFASYRDRKPKLGKKRDGRLDSIDDDVIESTNVFYQHTNKLLIIEYNHYGAKGKQIETYLSEFLPKSENEIWAVELIEIEAPIGLSDVMDSEDIRSIEIKMDMTSNQAREINNPEEPNSLTANVIREAVNTHSELGGNVAQLYFANGRKKGNPLKPGEVRKILRAIDLESDLYVSIKVKYYSNMLSKINELDVKNAGILKKEIFFEGDSWEVIADTIESDFYDNGRMGEHKHNKFTEIYSANFPGIHVKNEQ